MEKFKICPGCGTHNNPLAIECESCGEDLSCVRIQDSQQEMHTSTPAVEPQNTPMVRICDECGAKNEPQARKCAQCGEDISLIALTPDEAAPKHFSLSSTDGKFAFEITEKDAAITIGRECGMQEYLLNKLFVSRRHAELSVADGVLQIKSFETAKNGTHINGVAIAPNEPVALHDGDIVGLGGNDASTQKDAAYFQVVVM